MARPRQRRAANIAFVEAQSIRNKEVLEKKDPAIHAQNLAALRATAADPARHKEYLIRSSMIWSLRHAARLPSEILGEIYVIERA